MDRGTRAAPRFRVPWTRLLAGLLAVLVGGAGLWIAVVDDPLGGEPHALVPVAQRTAAEEAPAARDPGRDARVVAVPSDARERTAAEVEGASGVSVVRPDGTSAPASVVIRVPDAAPVRLEPAPDRRLTDRTRHGLLPRIGPDGAKPLQVYARPAGSLPGGARPAGRIAVLITGLGISQATTGDAIARLPPAVTLAFAPYGGDLERLVARAREDGHEVVLQVPMEPFDYPDNDPGPHTLLAAGKPQDNLDRLHWVMARFTGYVGVVNFMGAKLTADEAALAPILREIGGRGLGVLDDGSSARSRAVAAGLAAQTPTAKADLVIDAVPRADLIDKELARLEETARAKGFALGSASALPLSVERIARWARDLEGRGLLLVPASAAFAQGAAQGATSGATQGTASGARR